MSTCRKQNFLVLLFTLHYLPILIEKNGDNHQVQKFQVRNLMPVRNVMFFNCLYGDFVVVYLKIVMSYSGKKERKFSVFLSCSDDGLRQCRQMYKWLVKNHFEVVFDDENSLASMNLLGWVENQIKQASHCCYDFCVIMSAFLTHFLHVIIVIKQSCGEMQLPEGIKLHLILSIYITFICFIY